MNEYKQIDQIKKLAREKKFLEAYSLLNKRLEESPNSVDLIIVKAIIMQVSTQELEPNLSTKEYYKLIKEELERAYELNPESPKVLIELASFLYTHEGQNDIAKKYLNKSISLLKQNLSEASRILESIDDD